ncbi:MAG: phytoene/squalene synthase family protein [Bernardetiaceae bacterium]
MIDLFHLTAFKCSKLITQHYSTSFTLGIQTLDKSLHYPIYAIYGFVRYADEIVDTFHEFDKADLLARFKANTYQAIEEKISLNPILNAFQLVVHQYNIDLDLIEAFLHSMEMDLHHTRYEKQRYEEYIYGSAEVVGLMCLQVFCEGNRQEYESLKEPARRLGAAFQKVNFLRDMKSDFDDRGRVYFPNLNYQQFDQHTKAAIEADIEADFKAAHAGIVRLPKKARFGVYLAYRYYIKLFQKIKRSSTETLLDHRIRVPDAKKMYLLVSGYCRHQLNYI